MRSACVVGREGGKGLVVDANDLSAALLSSVDKQLGLALLLDGHGGSVQHCRHKKKRRNISSSGAKETETPCTFYEHHRTASLNSEGHMQGRSL